MDILAEVALSDYLSLAEAVQRYSVSRSTLVRLIRAGTLSRYKRVGDRKTYLLKKQVEEVLGEPRPA